MIQETKYKHLFTPMNIGKLQVKNRISYAPVGTGISENNTSAFNEAEASFYATRARGGAGLIFTGAVFTDLEVDPYTPGSLGVWNISHNPPLFKLTASKMLDRVHSYGTKMFIQLSLGVGRNSGLKSPSAIPTFADPSKTSPVLTTEELQKKIQYLIDGAVTAKSCGFDGVEIHAMHFGYLLDSLEMIISNQRTDQYGGSFENRMRTAKEILDGIKEKCGHEFPVSMRLGMKSYMKGFNQSSLHGEDEAGRTIEDAIAVSKYLEEIGYDLLSVDVGTNDSYYYCYPPMYLDMGLNVELAAQVKAAVTIPVIVCGRMHDPKMCEETVATGKADGVVVGRAMIADPDFAIKIKKNKEETIRPCLSCNIGCRGKMQSGLGLSCVVNPVVMKEETFKLTPALRKKTIMVIGGGVGGLESARAAAERGHSVTLYEKNDRLGGMINVAGAPEFKEEDRKLIEWYQGELASLGVEVFCDKEVDLAFILSESSDAVISACGAVPTVPRIVGTEHEKVVSFTDVMLGKKPVGKKVVVVGGGLVGCETALHLARNQHEITIVEFLDDILAGAAPAPPMNKMCLVDLFEDYHVGIKTSSALQEVNDTGAVIKTPDGLEVLEADTVVLAVGLRSRTSLVADLEKYNIEAYSVGDERKVANILSAVSAGYEIGRNI